MRTNGVRITHDNKDLGPERGGRDDAPGGRQGACFMRVEAVMRSCAGVATLAWAAGWTGAHR